MKNTPPWDLEVVTELRACFSRNYFCSLALHAAVFFLLRALAGTFLFLLDYFLKENITEPPLLRSGIGAALTVPSGLSLIVEWFPEPEEQNKGIAMFGGCGGLGNGAYPF